MAMPVISAVATTFVVWALRKPTSIK